MISRQKHIIYTQELELQVSDPDRTRELHELFGQLSRGAMANLLDRYCSRFCPPEETIRIDTLELDLGELPASLDEGAILKAFEKALSTQFPARPKMEEEIRPSWQQHTSPRESVQNSDLELIAFFLAYGALPWWADRKEVRPVEGALLRLASSSSGALRNMLTSLRRAEISQKRLVSALGEAGWMALLESLLPFELKDRSTITFLPTLLTTTLAQHRSISARKAHRLLQLCLLEWASDLEAKVDKTELEALLSAIATLFAGKRIPLWEMLQQEDKRLTEVEQQALARLKIWLQQMADSPSARATPRKGANAEATPTAQQTPQAKDDTGAKAGPTTTAEEQAEDATDGQSQAVKPSPNDGKSGVPGLEGPPKEQEPGQTEKDDPARDSQSGSVTVEKEGQDHPTQRAPTDRNDKQKQLDDDEKRIPDNSIIGFDADQEEPSTATEDPRGDTLVPPGVPGREGQPKEQETPQTEKDDPVWDSQSGSVTIEKEGQDHTEESAVDHHKKLQGKQTDQSHGQVTRDGGKSPARRLITKFSETDEIFLDNAGVVVLGPFLPQFFATVGLVENNQWVSEEAPYRGVYLLHYLLTGIEEISEAQTPLLKVLCGLLPTDLFADEFVLSEDQRQECGVFLQSVISHASILGDMSVDGFRGTFLLREGMLNRRDGHWLVQVERQTFDVVMDRFPWPFNIIKLPWMRELISVEW